MEPTFSSDKHLAPSSSSESDSTLGDLVPGTLRPITSRETGRYDRNFTFPAPSFSTVSPPSLNNSLDSNGVPRYLPPKWTAYVQPEGQPYFVRDTSLRVTTDSDVYDPEIKQKVDYWTKHIENELVEKDMRWSDSWELYVGIYGNDCDYYIVDHNLRSQFWIGSVDICEFDMAAAVSSSHLEMALQSLYWTHVEFFPMHMSGLPRQCIDELICIFNHGLLDQLTSSGSTFYYSKEDCEKFVQLLQVARDYPSDGYQTCLVARLQTQICNQRFETHYGEQHVRLTRDRVSPELAQPSRLTARVVSVLSLGMARRYSEELDVLYIDQTVYAHAWRTFISTCLQEWKESFIYTSLSFLLHLIFVFAPGSSVLTMTSLLLFTGSVTASSLLIKYYRPLEKCQSGTAHEHIQSVQSNKNQFLLVALTYSLPSALHLWGICVVVINCIISIFSHFGFVPAIAWSCFVCIAFLFFSIVFSSIHIPSPRSLFSRKEKTAEDLV
ncbi:hypothetical protein BDZ89DRAFT_1025309 [Hymenopellis radicata]|nr:hypothetical protein BDZ89DRAFT_1025309 [Hymenopellis radicata]